VIDFEGVDNKILFFNNLELGEGDYLVIKNLGNNIIAGGYPGSMSNGNLPEQARKIAIEVDGKLMSIDHYWPGKHWWCEWTPYRIITATNAEWVPIPEPATYGALFAAMGVGVMTLRRRLGGRINEQLLAKDHDRV